LKHKKRNPGGQIDVLQRPIGLKRAIDDADEKVGVLEINQHTQVKNQAEDQEKQFAALAIRLVNEVPQEKIHHRRKYQEHKGIGVQHPQIHWPSGAFVVKKQGKNGGEQQTQVETAQQQQVQGVKNKKQYEELQVAKQQGSGCYISPQS